MIVVFKESTRASRPIDRNFHQPTHLLQFSSNFFNTYLTINNIHYFADRSGKALRLDHQLFYNIFNNTQIQSHSKRMFVISSFFY